MVTDPSERTSVPFLIPNCLFLIEFLTALGRGGCVFVFIFILKAKVAR